MGFHWKDKKDQVIALPNIVDSERMFTGGYSSLLEEDLSRLRTSLHRTLGPHSRCHCGNLRLCPPPLTLLDS